MITDYFDGAFVINLDHRADRMEKVQKEFDRLNLTVERVSGIVGNPSGLVTVGKQGDVGCTLSHVKCIQIAKSFGWNDVLIFEDDVEFRDNANDLFDKYAPLVPDDWDMIYLGGNHWGRDLRLTPQMVEVAPNIYKTTHTLTTHAYAIKQTMYNAVINYLGKANKQVDVMYVDLQELFNVYAIFPNLAWQRADKSDINGKQCDYSFMKDRDTL
jgi:glycosyl transferase family 25